MGCINEGDFLRHILAIGTTDKKALENTKVGELVRRDFCPALNIDADETNVIASVEKYIYNEQNGLHYELVGDYYRPLLTVPEVPPLGIWGRRRHRYLKEHRPVIYNTMFPSGKLFTHLAEVDQQAQDMHDRL